MDETKHLRASHLNTPLKTNLTVLLPLLLSIFLAGLSLGDEPPKIKDPLDHLAAKLRIMDRMQVLREISKLNAKEKSETLIEEITKIDRKLPGLRGLVFSSNTTTPSHAPQVDRQVITNITELGIASRDLQLKYQDEWSQEIKAEAAKEARQELENERKKESEFPLGIPFGSPFGKGGSPSGGGSGSNGSSGSSGSTSNNNFESSMPSLAGGNLLASLRGGGEGSFTLPAQNENGPGALALGKIEPGQISQPSLNRIERPASPVSNLQNIINRFLAGKSETASSLPQNRSLGTVAALTTPEKPASFKNAPNGAASDGGGPYLTPSEGNGYPRSDFSAQAAGAVPGAEGGETGSPSSGNTTTDEVPPMPRVISQVLPMGDPEKKGIFGSYPAGKIILGTCRNVSKSVIDTFCKAISRQIKDQVALAK